MADETSPVHPQNTDSYIDHDIPSSSRQSPKPFDERHGHEEYQEPNDDRRLDTDLEKGPDLEAIRTHRSQLDNADTLFQVQSHISHQDLHTSTIATFREENEDQYLRFSPARKIVIVAILSFCSFLAPVSSTSILAAVPEVAKTFNTTGSVINASNAVYMLFMGLAATFWGPLSQVWGRKPVSYDASFARMCVRLMMSRSVYPVLQCSLRLVSRQHCHLTWCHISFSEPLLRSQGRHSLSLAVPSLVTSTRRRSVQLPWAGFCQGL